ncbi:MAG: Spermidine synthase [Thermoleophilia bacterium]|nr:Spermidine synthase [Thermoleophilia bacterium]
MPSEPRSQRATRRLRLVVFASGTATMALQMAAVRLLAPWMGASSIVWATIIGLSLLALSVGYVLGGRLADRLADGPTLARTLAAAGILTAMVPVIAPSLLPHARLGIEQGAWSDLVGAGVAYAVLFLGPCLLLGVTPPYAIRLALAHVDDAGRTAGRLYALSTVGSILGTLLTALVLVQWIGTRATLVAIAVVLLLAAVAARRVSAVVGRADDAQAVRATGAGVLTVRLAGAIVLVEGLTLMASEMSVARLVAPFFGASHAVWAIIIATVMGSIALGSRLGGRCADRWPTLGALVSLLAIASSAVAVLPFVAAPVMRLSTGGIDEVAIGTVVGTFLATMALLVVPMTLLGMIPPWVLRLAVEDVTRAGGMAGRLYALSTTGALVGTFASVLWLIPTLGTRRTMLLFAGALALLAAALWLRRLPAVGRRSTLLAPASLVLVLGLAFAPTGLVKPLDGDHVLTERESRYQFIQVVEEPADVGGRRLLQLNEGWAVHSIWSPDTVLTGGIWDHFLVLPALLEREGGWDDPDATQSERSSRRSETQVYPPCSDSQTMAVCATSYLSDSAGDLDMLVIGSAAGTAARAYREIRPTVEMTSVELDPRVTAVGEKYFEHDGEDVIAEDGRPFLAGSDDRWDVIHVDAYRQPYIPFYLTTREFFGLAKSRLEPGGIFSINVGSTPEDPRINEAVAASMRAAFPLVARYRAEEYNEVIVGINDPDVTLDELRERIGASDLARGDAPYFDKSGAEDPDQLAALFTDFAAGMREVEPDPERVLTDDRAAVEWMTDRMIFGAAD